MEHKWVSVTERLPEINEDETYYKKVIACWGTDIHHVAEMKYCRRIVRGKTVYRFEWDGRISPWEVKYWMELPQPPDTHIK